jgi:hypothetical protein
MGRKIKEKEVQTHVHCLCGSNVVEQDFYPIRWADFKAAGIKRKIDKSTGKPFLLMEYKTAACIFCQGDD